MTTSRASADLGLPDLPVLRNPRLLRILVAPSAPIGIALFLLGLGACWYVAFVGGRSLDITRHYFYLPVLFVAIRFRLPGALLGGLAAALVAGPLVPLPADEAALNTFRIWGTRGALFLVIGLFVALIMKAIAVVDEHDEAVADQRRSLEIQHAQFLQVVSHELRTPLTTIVGIALTYTRDELDDAQRTMLDASLLRASRRLQAMVESTLAAGEIFEVPAHREIDLHGFLEETVAAFETQADRVDVDLTSAPSHLMSSAPHLRMIVSAVVDNALKFSSPETRVLIVVRQDVDETVLSVVDRGPGVAPEIRDQVFAPFTQGDRSATRQHGGLGLGLFVAVKAAEAIGASISLRDGATSGTVARVALRQRRGMSGEGEAGD